MPIDIEIIECWNCGKTYDLAITESCDKCGEHRENEPCHIDEHEEEK